MRLRWRAIFHLQDIEPPVSTNTTIDPDPESENSDSENKENEASVNMFGFKSSATPPQVKELLGFESDWWKLIDSIKFSNKRMPFQKQLNKDC